MPKNLTAWVAIALALFGLLGGVLQQFYELKIEVREIRAEMRWLHGEIQLPKGH
jgi:hypothetical protein